MRSLKRLRVLPVTLRLLGPGAMTRLQEGQARLEKRELPNLGGMSWDSEYINSFTKYLFLL